MEIFVGVRGKTSSLACLLHIHLFFDKLLTISFVGSRKLFLR